MVPPERLHLGGRGEPGGARAWCAPEECGRQGFVDVHMFTNLDGFSPVFGCIVHQSCFCWGRVGGILSVQSTACRAAVSTVNFYRCWISVQGGGIGPSCSQMTE